MCFIPLSRSLAASVFPWFPVHICWQRLLVLVLCPVLCNGDLVGLGPIYSPQPSAAWAAVHPDRTAFSSRAGARCGTCLWNHYIIDSLCFETLQSLRPSVLLSILLPFRFLQIVKICRSESSHLLMRFRSFCLRPHFWGKVEFLISRNPIKQYLFYFIYLWCIWCQQEVDGLKLQMVQSHISYTKF